ncbi:hypothetical protein [Jannaschia seohaensis]|uniref:Uncharacterized protein n=1 Tax=Jannaschia seohaensis TaxID=475081 RepID=A0A2Y9AGR9_9RHOB|nr:hypothetical protein [Jannaschia seohaensis]PWJ21157.1 hypothetical protein BCF38_102407 [Jannaschia seohaensis]SSA41567.1 hypothetical protein SAMN05421539_102407 [Jannaschia seohaensis]
MRAALLSLLLAGATPVAAEHVPLRFEEAQSLIGRPVLSADAVPLGRLVATRALPDGGFHSIVLLDEALEAGISALIVEGLARAPDGSLRLAEAADVLADRMQLRIGDG